ncbi:hypothetical protein BX600DRAFT_267825 [Xylariales sp. PMI_506]|nr:hypothetical protein BX600DRAFT_267825 [Xylariales sp. PMI_506]
MSSDAKEGRYDCLQDDDHDDDASSEIDAEELTALAAADYIYTPARSKRQRLMVAISRGRWIFDIILILVIAGLVADRQWSWSQRKYWQEQQQGTGDITGFAPRFSQRIMNFEPDSQFMPANASEFWSKETQDRWLSLVPKGLGYLNIKTPEKYHDLPVKLPKQYGRGYTVTTSLTHQLHCLHSLAEVFSAYRIGRSDKIPEDPWHIAHCFDYIRQSVMCSADVALEGKATTFPEGVTGSDGWDAKHVCKNYDEVLAYLNDNRANDIVWI